MAIKDRPTDFELLHLQSIDSALVFDDSGKLVAVRIESTDGVRSVYTRRFETKLVDEMPEPKDCLAPVQGKRCSRIFTVRKASKAGEHRA